MPHFKDAPIKAGTFKRSRSSLGAAILRLLLLCRRSPLCFPFCNHPAESKSEEGRAGRVAVGRGYVGGDGELPLLPASIQYSSAQVSASTLFILKIETCLVQEVVEEKDVSED
jgi:hypothetical protein